MIKLNHITKRFESGGRTVTAVDDVSLAINAGEVFGIIGFSGAGKSTLVRCINLLERPTSGEVIVDGVDLTQLDEKALRQVRQRIGMIFQHFNLMPSRTVTENIEMPLKLTTLTPAERKAKISSLLELVELSDKADAYPSQLSGGQKQRVAIARALANDPKVLLCDEATSALDPKTTRSIKARSSRSSRIPKCRLRRVLLIQRRMSMISMNSLKKLVRATASITARRCICSLIRVLRPESR